MFFSFDGIDGVGKSTQVGLFVDALRRAGHDVVACRDPGSTPLGENIRQLLLTPDESVSIARERNAALHGGPVQLVDEIIRPALDAGKTVVSDRYVLANIVCQGHAGGLDTESIRRVGIEATRGIAPGCTFLLDMPPELADTRLNRSLDRMERQGPDYRRRLRDGFLAEAARPASAIHVIDARQPIDAVHAAIWAIATRHLSPK